MPDPGHNCAFLDTAGQHTWQSSSCSKKLGYICHRDGSSPAPPQSKTKHSNLSVSLCDRSHLTSSSCCFFFLFQPQLSKGFVLAPGFPTTATAFTSIVLLKHGQMLRKSAAKKVETSSASTTWRSRALSFLNLDLVHTENIALFSQSLFHLVYPVLLSLMKLCALKSFHTNYTCSHNLQRQMMNFGSDLTTSGQRGCLTGAITPLSALLAGLLENRPCPLMQKTVY